MQPEPTGREVLTVQDLSVEYDGALALRGVTLTGVAGEVLALLGPSGSGKSTLLHAVAGFRAPSTGEVRLHGRLVASPARAEPPERRDVAVVFQNYALWPHLSVLDTVAYPARRRRVDRGRARRDALAILDRLNIAHLAGRRPAELSGGEAQRVGLARALARHASLYLFDEPTAHLDTHVRGLFLEELLSRQRDSGAAALYATHDAEEALGLADRVALLDAGRIVQVGSPSEVYAEPVDLWAARLTGPASLLRARLRRADARTCAVELADRQVSVRCDSAVTYVGGVHRLLVRPGWAGLGGELPGRVRAVWFRGPHSDHLVETPAGSVLLREPGAPRCRVGEPVGWALHRTWVLGERGAAPGGAALAQPPSTIAGPG